MTRTAEPDDADDDRESDGEELDESELDLPVPDLDDATALRLLAGGELAIVGRLVASTNNALLCIARAGDLAATCVYKPVMGERPLDDFPDGTLARREVAAFSVSSATGWGIVPPTVLREGPFGEGMVQRWIDVDREADPIAMVVEGDERLRRVAVFDAAINNTDRKAGHLLPVSSGHVYGVDHGVCFSPVPKLRTVLWNWRGEPFTEDELAVLRALRSGLDGDLGAGLRELLAPHEVAATARRIDGLLERRAFPQPEPGRPALPWPPV